MSFASLYEFLPYHHSFAVRCDPGHLCTSGCPDSNNSFLINALGTLKVGVFTSSGTTRSIDGNL